MAEGLEEPSQKALASQFPNPPPFWRSFTTDNIARVGDLHASRAEKEGIPLKELTTRIPDLPEDLINLQPPAEPQTGQWKVLGGQYTLDDKLPSLEETSIKRLAPEQPEERDGKHLDRAFELKRTSKSLLLNFLELIGTMSIRPEDAAAKGDDLRTLFINMHHVLNEYRPHQARESAIALLQAHLDRTRAETAAIRAQVDKARRVIEGLGSLEIPSIDDVDTAREADRSDPAAREKMVMARDAEVWSSADALFA